MRHLLTGLVLFIALIGSTAQAITLTSGTTAGKLNLSVSDIAYPSQFIDKELDSGLPNTISLIVSLQQGAKKPLALSFHYQIVYDLWDERYIVKQLNSNGVFATHRFKTKPSLLTYLGHLKIAPLADETQFNLAQPVLLSSQVIVNPVKTERIKKVQAWIASSNGFSHKNDKTTANTAYMGINGNQTITVNSIQTAVVRSSGPRFQKLFDQILAQYLSTDEIPALWRSKMTKISVQLNHEN
jgi:hypothetical protein